MKLLNILSAVIAIHVAVLAIAIPGCRSSSKSAGPVSPAIVEESTSRANGTIVSSPISAAPELSDRDLNPPLVSAESPMFDPNAPAVAKPSFGTGSRFSPLRPQSAVATAMQPAEKFEVTPAVTYTVKRGDNLWTLARKNGLSVRELAAANDLRPDAGLRLDQVLVIPGKQMKVVAATSSTGAAETTTYLIQPGDTLAVIARRHGTTVAQLKAFNNLRSNLVRAGDRLAIPEAPAPVTEKLSTETPAVETAVTVGSGSGVYKHVVASGESLNVIARRYGVKRGVIELANMIKDPSLIRVGQELKIPGAKVPEELPTPAESSFVRPAVAPATSSVLRDDGDLDEGLDDMSLQNVPVIQVEDAPAEDDEPSIKTIHVGGENSDDPPLSR